MYCCPQCFHNSSLKLIVESLSAKEAGKCSFCQEESNGLVKPSDLEDVFQPIIDVFTSLDDLDLDYIQESPSTLLIHLNQRWSVFSNTVTDQQALLLAIFSRQKEANKILTDPVYIRCLNSKETFEFIRSWEQFLDEVKQHNRFLPRVSLDSLRLQDILSRYVKTVKAGTRIFRARITMDDVALSDDQMGKPPRNKATGGRANPSGIPYLYVSYDIETPIYESRAGLIDYVTVAEFELTQDLTVVPLCDFRNINPFESEDDSDLDTALTMEKYLKLFERELSRPIRKQDQELDYIPTQYLCEFIKRQINVDGVEYSSSVKKGGKNLVLFMDDHKKLVSKTVHRVKSISLEIERLS